jgi:hypothetical protein
MPASRHEPCSTRARTQIREKAEGLLHDVPADLQDYLKTQMGTLMQV